MLEGVRPTRPLPVLRDHPQAADGSASAGGGPNPVTGYTLLSANDLESAVSLAKGCPILATGGTIEVAETIEM